MSELTGRSFETRLAPDPARAGVWGTLVRHRRPCLPADGAVLELGADRVVIERRPDHGSCRMRALAEAADGADLIVLREGDRTFSGGDIREPLAYLENSDLVRGTRETAGTPRARHADALAHPSCRRRSGAGSGSRRAWARTSGRPRARR
jgi:hypothetical protein